MTRSEAGKIGGIKQGKISHDNAVCKYYKEPNICKYCHSVIKIKEGEQISQVRKKNFCSHSCSAQYNNLKRGRKIFKCVYCDKLIHQTNSRIRKYCDNICQGKLRRKAALDIAFACERPINSGALRNFLFEKYNNKCCKCGWGETNLKSGTIPLVINHIDGNSSNNKEDNLELICPNCDSLTPTYKGMNKGSGRHHRKERYQKGLSY